MACPCFYPIERAGAGAGCAYAGRPVPPLGDLWLGICRCAPQDPWQPDPSTSEKLCNFGYAAHHCPRFPPAEPDAIRFSIAHDQQGVIRIQWVMEKDYVPFAHGRLEYSRERAAFLAPHPDARVNRQAEVYVSSYLRRVGNPS